MFGGATISRFRAWLVRVPSARNAYALSLRIATGPVLILWFFACEFVARSNPNGAPSAVLVSGCFVVALTVGNLLPGLANRREVKPQRLVSSGQDFTLSGLAAIVTLLAIGSIWVSGHYSIGLIVAGVQLLAAAAVAVFWHRTVFRDETDKADRYER